MAVGAGLRDKSKVAPRQQAGRFSHEAHLWNEPLGLTPGASWGQPQGPVQSSEPVAVETRGQEVREKVGRGPHWEPHETTA